MLQRKQFHEMSREEFEARPGTYFHGHPTGNFNWSTEGRPQGFHVGTRQAAEDAVNARAAFGKYAKGAPIPAPMKASRTEHPTGHILPNGVEMKEIRTTTHPEAVRGGRIVSPMVNQPGYMGIYGRGDLGDMYLSGDVQANGRVAAINRRGQTMRRGIYYKNAAEDAGSVSAVLPSRQSWKTHEDYIVEARARGMRVPAKALEGYKEIPGQQRLF